MKKTKCWCLENNIQIIIVEIPSSYKIYYANGQWCVDGKPLHREDGPAIEYRDGQKSYFQYGKRHREDGPAIEDSDGNKRWIINDELHREDGPAVECADGTIEYWLCDKKFDTKEEWEHYRDYLMIMG